ncbi:MAG: S-adenosyl-l-methionine hydroxide adenosyltransferase family protein [Candidatus Sulfotelmatobacter sp.]
MIEKRDSFACTISTFSQGLKPTGISNASRGAEAPLFHGTSGFRRALRFCSAPTFYGFRHSRGIRGFRNASPVRIFSFILLVLVLVLVLALSVMAQAQTEKYPQTIVFMTDFGVVDDSVALCKGVMYSIVPQVRIVDLTHEVTPFSILDGARFLYGATPYFPAGTVFVVVIDPTVGSTRKAIVAKSKRGQYFVLPDNGLLTLVEQRDGIESVHEVTNPDWMLGTKMSSTFHGRDIFSPAGAHVARGDDWTKAGPEMPVASLVRLELKAARVDERGASAEVIATDGPFGNLVTNLAAEDFLKLGYQRGQEVPVRIGGKEMKVKFVKTFSDVALGQPLLYIDSRGRFALAVNQGSFAAVYGVKPPEEFSIARAK